MANTIKLKQGSGSDPSASDLVLGEPAVRTDTAEIFLKKDDGTVAKLSGGGLSDGDKGDITVSNSAATFTIDSGVIDNANIASNAAIAGTKISPDFGSQNVTTTGDVNCSDITLSDNQPRLNFVDNAGSPNDPDYLFQVDGGTFLLHDSTNAADRFSVAADGTVRSHGNHDFSAGIDVTGNITVSGTVDGVDIAALNTTVSGKLSDVVDDTSPQLGGPLNTNSQIIKWPDSSGSSVNRAVFGAGNDLQIYHDESKSVIADTGTGGLFIAGSSISLTNDGITETMLYAVPDGAVNLYFDNSIKLNTNSGGVAITGHAYFPDNNGTHFGAGEDFKIYHDGTNNRFDSNGLKNFIFRPKDTDVGLKIIGDGGVELYYDNGKKLESTSSGIDVTGTINSTGTITITNEEPKILFVDSGHNPDYQLQNTNGTFKIKDATNGIDRFKVNSDGHVDIQDNLDVGNGIDVTGGINADGLSTFSASGSAVRLNDGSIQRYGNADDDYFQYYDGSNDIAYLSVGASRFFRLTTANFNIYSANNTEVLFKAIENGATELYYDNSKKLETSSAGVTMSGNIFFPDQKELQLGGNTDLRLYHDGHSIIRNDETGAAMFIASHETRFINTSFTENQAKFIQNGAVELYYDAGKKAETVSGGFTISGTCTATTFSGSGASLTNIPAPENAAFAWINFNSTNNSIRGSYNVSSISDHGTGNFSVNFTNNASNNNYAVQINGTNTTSNTAISFLLSASGPNLNSNAYADGNFSTSAFRFVMGYGPSSVSMDTNLVCATVHES